MKIWKISKHSPYMSVLIKSVIGKFHFLKWNTILHPFDTRCWRFRMYIELAGHLRFSFPSCCPLFAIKLVSRVVSKHEIHEDEVGGFGIKSRYWNFQGWKHSPENWFDCLYKIQTLIKNQFCLNSIPTLSWAFTANDY